MTAIKCYLFTSLARQINHTYFSLEYNKYLFFYYNLVDFHDKVNRILVRPFVYEVEIKPETVLECNYSGLKATEFKVVREVEFTELVNSYNLSTRTRNEINSILNGSMDSQKVVSLYKRFFQKSKWVLSTPEQFKFLAILNQNCYELPTITISRYSEIPNVRLLKFFNKPYTTTFTGFYSNELNKFKQEEFYGSKEFEMGIDLPMKELICHPNLKEYRQTRKLSQEQFEEYCEYMYNEERTMFYSSYAIAAGYKILPKYKKHFYPYLIYSEPELVLDLFNKEKLTELEFEYFYEKNYKITSDFNYSNDKVKEAKAIFVKEEQYKQI